MRKFLKFFCFVTVCILLFVIVVSAHSGRTDSSGGHYDSSTGEYHYHHGYSAHQHYDIDGDGKIDCPYEFDDKTNHGSNTVVDDDWTEANINKEIKFKDIVAIVFEILLRLLMSLFFTFLFTWAITDLIEKKAKNRLSDHAFDVIWKIIFFSCAIIAIVATLLIVLFSNEIL